MVNDACRAYVSAPARRQVFVELLEKDSVEGEGMVGEPNFSMYGTRGAAQNWGEDCASTKGGNRVRKRQRSILYL